MAGNLKKCAGTHWQTRELTRESKMAGLGVSEKAGPMEPDWRIL
jgi:hypothetical protein